MDATRLFELYNQIPLRQPRGTISNWSRGGKITMFNNEARRLGLSIQEANKLCQDKNVSGGISQSIC